MSMAGRSAAIVGSTLRSALIQPIRRPPQNDLDIEPTVNSRSRRWVIVVPNGGGTCSSSHMSVMVSSMIVRVRVSLMMCANLFRPGSGSVIPVGFWLSGIR